MSPEQDRVEVEWNPGLGIVTVRNTASQAEVDFSEQAWDAFLAARFPAAPGPAERDIIIARLAAAFGPHKSYDRATRRYEPDGNDEAATPSIVYVAEDGHNSFRFATYGEIADALTAVQPDDPADTEAADVT